VQLPSKFESQGEVRCALTPAGKALTTTHEGPYEKLHESHDALQAWASTSQVKLAPVSWEVYGPWNDDPSALRTELFHLLAP
jgi:effector-binding domain-containing protein